MWVTGKNACFLVDCGVEVRELINQLAEVFEGEPWYGNSISTYFQEAPATSLNTRFANGHSAGQIIAHMIAWRQYVIDKLQGADKILEVGSVEDWENKAYDSADKTVLFEKLKATQQTLIQLLGEKDDAFLQNKVPGKPYTFERLVNGIIQHDIYHLGQLYVLRASRESSTT